MPPQKQGQVRKRDEHFAERTVTRIWDEEPADSNPYLATRSRCYGYDIIKLAQNRSFVDVIFLLFQGELPSRDQARLLEALMVACISPGPRHPATRAAMYAGVGKTDPAHILPISLSVLGGSFLGGKEVENAMLFLRSKGKLPPVEVADGLERHAHRPPEGDWHIAPGFGSRFGDIDPLPRQIADVLLKLPGSGKTLQWGEDFSQRLQSLPAGWLTTGVTAAVLCDLGFHPRAGAGMFQILSAPGLLAQGLEIANKPISAMPFLDKEHYVIENKIRPG